MPRPLRRHLQDGLYPLRHFNLQPIFIPNFFHGIKLNLYLLFSLVRTDNLSPLQQQHHHSNQHHNPDHLSRILHVFRPNDNLERHLGPVYVHEEPEL